VDVLLKAAGIQEESIKGNNQSRRFIKVRGVVFIRGELRVGGIF
jgi:hypothetical protein